MTHNSSFKTIVVAVLAAVLSQPIASIANIEGVAAAGAFSGFSVPQNLGSPINTADNEELPTISPNGLSMYFSSNRAGGQGGLDIWVSQRPTLSSAWGTPQNLGATVNTASGDNLASISPDGREMFMHSNRAGGTGGVDLYVSTRTDPNNDLGWTAPVNLGPVVNSTLADQNANYFVNPATGAGTLFFASDRSSGTTGVKDIFQSTRNADGTFNVPTIVNELNSPADEARTAISRDGLEIFLSSSRLSTVFATFVSTRASISSPWNAPVPLNGLNSGGSAAQPALSADGTVLYFTSNRTGGSGNGDLYSVTRGAVNRTVAGDFDGDGRSDISIFRPSDGSWWIMQSGTNTLSVRQFGVVGDKVVTGDYDGDGRTDLGLFRPSDRNWYIHRSSDNVVSVTNWGLGTDRPVPGDYDGDGRTDIGVYRDGVWYIIFSSTGLTTYFTFGVSSDIPITGIAQ